MLPSTGSGVAPSVLETESVTASYGGNQVLNNVSIQLRSAEVLCLVGHNGAGKSTLLRLMYGLHPLGGGTVRLRGNSIRPSPGRMANEGAVYVPEGRGVFPSLSVQANFSLALWSAGLKGNDAVERIEEVLSILPNIKSFWTRQAGQLSGGQQQMVSVGRALLSRPSILLLDEPSIGLAPKTFQDLIRPVRQLQRQRGMSILLVEQNLGEAFGVCDRVVVMKNGKLIFAGVPADFSNRDKLMELY
jgi:branched-chain amino acid transport system ATP-binding protein